MARHRKHEVKFGGIYTVLGFDGYYTPFLRLKNNRWRLAKCGLDGSIEMGSARIVVPGANLTRVDAKTIKPIDAAKGKWDAVEPGSLLRMNGSSTFVRVVSKMGRSNRWSAEIVKSDHVAYSAGDKVVVSPGSTAWSPATEAEFEEAKTEEVAPPIEIPTDLPPRLATAYMIAFGGWPTVDELIGAVRKNCPSTDDAADYDVRAALLKSIESTCIVSTMIPKITEKNCDCTLFQIVVPINPTMEFSHAETTGEVSARALDHVIMSIDAGDRVSSLVITEALSNVRRRVQSMTDGIRKAKEDARSFAGKGSAFDGCAPTQKQSDRIVSFTKEYRPTTDGRNVARRVLDDLKNG